MIPDVQRAEIITQPDVEYERPLDAAETALYDHFRYLGCGTVVDPLDIEDCAFMAVHVVAVLRQLGFMPVVVAASPPGIVTSTHTRIASTAPPTT